MSSKFNDWKNSLFFTVGVSPTAALATSVTSPAIDMATCANNQVFVQMQVGVAAGTETVFIGNIQECPNTTAASFTNVTAFSTITTSMSAQVQIISFQRTQRFVRFSGTIIGTTAAIPVAVLIGGQKSEVT